MNNSTINHDLDLQTAVDWTTAWRAAHATTPGYIKAFLVDLSEVNEIMAETGAASIRVYFGLDGTTEKLILVGVDANGNDIINPEVNHLRKSGTYDFNTPCPPVCGIDSPLMTGQMPPG